MPQPPIDKRLIGQGANAIYQAFGIYRSRFKEITRRAPLRFKNRDWHGVQTDAILRLDLYKDAVDHIEIDIRRLLAGHLQEKKVWALIKAAYSDLLTQNESSDLSGSLVG